MVERYDICVIGGGLAGLSVASLLAASRRVVVLEREPHLAYHSTGRSAALFAESYGNHPVRALTRASRRFYFEDHGAGVFTAPRGAMFVAGESEIETLDSLDVALRSVSPAVRRLTPDEASRRCPVLRAASAAGALLDPDARDIDVAAVVDHHVRGLRARGGTARPNAEVTRIDEVAGGWRIEAGGALIEASIIVDAAGAWADEIAALAGIARLGLTPLLRTAVRVSAGSWRVADWPCVIDAAERWYFRPDAQAILLSPADETPSGPCDAQPDDETVADAIARIENATRLVIERPLRAWAGLRTFAVDRTPVVGFDPSARGFFWLAGQGGYGIQTAPALAVLAAALIEGRTLPAELAAASVDPRAFDPVRLRTKP